MNQQLLEIVKSMMTKVKENPNLADDIVKLMELAMANVNIPLPTPAPTPTPTLEARISSRTYHRQDGLRETILKLISDKPISSGTIMEKLQIKRNEEPSQYNNVCKILKNLSEEKKIIRHGELKSYTYTLSALSMLEKHKASNIVFDEASKDNAILSNDPHLLARLQ